MVFKLSRKVYFCDFMLTLVRILSLSKKFRYMHLKVLITLFHKMIEFTEVWATVHEILAIKYQKWLRKNLIKLFTSNPNITKTVSHSIINNTIFRKYVTWPFRCIYVDYLDFLQRSAQNYKKKHLFRQFKDHNPGRKHRN